MTGDDFIALAGKLAASQSNNPAVLRTAVSRAYYGAFHLVDSFLRECQLVIREKSHNVDRYLKESGHPAAVHAGYLLGGLHEWRVRADYRLLQPAVESLPTVVACVEDAREIQSLLSECGNPGTRQEIKRGVEAYIRKLGNA